MKKEIDKKLQEKIEENRKKFLSSLDCGESSESECEILEMCDLSNDNHVQSNKTPADISTGHEKSIKNLNDEIKIIKISQSKLDLNVSPKSTGSIQCNKCKTEFSTKEAKR